MKTTKSIIVVLFVLLTAQIASAYYCPSTGRWLSRDPIGEPGFQALLVAGQTSIRSTPRPSTDRWIIRDSTSAPAFLRGSILGLSSKQMKQLKAESLMPAYEFVRNDPVNGLDLLGLVNGVITVPEPNPLPPLDPKHPERPSKRKVCRLLSARPPGTMLNPGCIKCWKCTYQCSPPGVGGGGYIQRWQIGGCLSVVGFVPGFDDQVDCEGASQNGPPTGLYPGDLDP